MYTWKIIFNIEKPWLQQSYKQKKFKLSKILDFAIFGFLQDIAISATHTKIESSKCMNNTKRRAKLNF